METQEKGRKQSRNMQGGEGQSRNMQGHISVSVLQEVMVLGMVYNMSI